MNTIIITLRTNIKTINIRNNNKIIEIIGTNSKRKKKTQGVKNYVSHHCQREQCPERWLLWGKYHKISFEYECTNDGYKNRGRPMKKWMGCAKDMDVTADVM